MHDTGYIRPVDEPSTRRDAPPRLEQSLLFMKGYFNRRGIDSKDLRTCRELVRCTEPHGDMTGRRFSSQKVRTLGMMLGTADIMGQMADRTYIEKLLFLFRELSEDPVLRYRNELDFLQNTLELYTVSRERLGTELGDVKRYLEHHFRERWDIDYDLYSDAIESNMNYLSYLMTDHRDDYRNQLKRGGLVTRLAIIEAKKKPH